VIGVHATEFLDRGRLLGCPVRNVVEAECVQCREEPLRGRLRSVCSASPLHGGKVSMNGREVW
jgi:hypothetical protein